MPTGNIWAGVTKAARKYFSGDYVADVVQAPLAINNEAIKAINAAGTGLVEIVKANASDQTEFLGTTQVFPNGSTIYFKNAAGTALLPAISSNASDQVTVGGEQSTANYKTVTFNSRQMAIGVGTARQFWIADSAYTVVGITESHSTAETTAATLTATINKNNSSGTTALMSNTFNCKATANTPQTATMSTVAGATSIAAGDRLMWSLSTSATELAGVIVTVVLAPGNRNSQTSVFLSNTIAVDGTLFIANRPMTITGIQYMHTAAASGTCTVQITKDTGTDAPGAGTDLLTDNAAAGFNCQATASVIQTGTLVSAAAARLATGDRLAMDFAGTTTGLTGVVITITFAASEDRKDVTFLANANGQHVDGAFFLADRAYEIVAARAVWSTAAAAGNAQLTVDSGTAAPGAGLDLLSMDTNAGFQIDGTANTVETATFINSANNFLLPGDRLSIDFSAATNIVGFVCTVTLRPA